MARKAKNVRPMFTPGTLLIENEAPKGWAVLRQGRTFDDVSETHAVNVLEPFARQVMDNLVRTSPKGVFRTYLLAPEGCGYRVVSAHYGM